MHAILMAIRNMLESRNRKNYLNSSRNIESAMMKLGRNGAPILGSTGASKPPNLSTGGSNSPTLIELILFLIALVAAVSFAQFSLVFLPLWSVVIVPDSAFAYGYWIPALVFLITLAIATLIGQGESHYKLYIRISALLLFIFYCFGVLKLTGVLPWDWPLICIPLYVICLFLFLILIAYATGCCNENTLK